MNDNYLIFARCILLLIVSFLLSNKLCKLLIENQRKRNEGQAVSIYLMESHQEKKKTPTGGGRGIIISILISSLFVIESYLDYLFTIGIIILISFFLIGFIDDLIKVKYQNYKGLSSLIRFLLEILIVIGIYYYLDSKSYFDYSFHLNESIYLNLGSLFIIFVTKIPIL